MNILLVGGGGVGVSALGILFRTLGFDVICVDKEENIFVQMQRERGAIYINQKNFSKEHVLWSDYIIYSKPLFDLPLIQYAYSIEKGCVDYGIFLGLLSNHLKTIAVAGTHGKSTTTALLIDQMYKRVPDFSLGIVGAQMPLYNNENCLINKKNKSELTTIVESIMQGEVTNLKNNNLIFVVEADEYQKKFLDLSVEYALITNITYDHTDIFPTKEDYVEAFVTFGESVSAKLYVHGDDAGVFNYSSIGVDPVTCLENFQFHYLFGEHNQKNATLVKAIIRDFATEISEEKITQSIEPFQGIGRRMEYLGSNRQKNIVYYSDYGHHPNEISAVLQSVQSSFPNLDIKIIIEIHETRRLLENWDRYSKILKKADESLLYSVYKARESFAEIKVNMLGKISGRPKTALDLADCHDDVGQAFAKFNEVPYLTTITALESALVAGKNTICIIFSAGKLDDIVRRLMKNIDT